jgi:hypothetical protein
MKRGDQTVLDFDDVREQICDELMEGKSVNGVELGDVLEGEIEFAHRLAQIWNTDRSYRQHGYDQLKDDCRKAVERFVNAKMDEEVTARLESAREDHDEYEPTI